MDCINKTILRRDRPNGQYRAEPVQLLDARNSVIIAAFVNEPNLYYQKVTEQQALLCKYDMQQNRLVRCVDAWVCSIRAI